MPDWDVQHQNLLNYASSFQRWCLEHLWQLVSTWPLLRSAYSWFHRLPLTNDRFSPYASLLFRRVGNRLAGTYAGVDIRGVIALHPGATCAAACWKSKRPFYLGVVATDLVVHCLHVLPSVDTIFADSRAVLASPLAKDAQNSARIVPTGLPVSKRFADIANRRRSSTSVHIVVSFGAKALMASRHLPLLIKLVEEVDRVTMTFVCGHNSKLRIKLSELVRRRGWSKRVEVVGFAKNMPELLLRADVIIGKAGGLTAGEALASKTPLLVIEALPGQEVYNAFVLERAGAARRVVDFAQLTAALSDLQLGAWRLGSCQSHHEQFSGIEAISRRISSEVALISSTLLRSTESEERHTLPSVPAGSFQAFSAAID